MQSNQVLRAQYTWVVVRNMRITKSQLRKMIREVVSEIDGSRFGRQFISPSDPNPVPLGVNDPDPMLGEDDLEEVDDEYEQ